jgi:hypothetical protein
MSATPILWEETIQPGAAWSHVLKRGTSLRLVDLEGGANVGGIFYNFECPVERYNMPDTLKAQHIARLSAGFVLYSDMGRILCSVIADTVGWHDPIGGTSNANLIAKKYGAAGYQESRNDYHKNGRDSFLIELGKWGLEPRDLTPNVNFFSRIAVDETGGMNFVPDNSKAGDSVELRAEMNVLVILNTCQHPLDPNPKYQPKPVQVEIRSVPAPASDDPCRISRPENGRGFTLTERYFL